MAITENPGFPRMGKGLHPSRGLDRQVAELLSQDVRTAVQTTTGAPPMDGATHNNGSQPTLNRTPLIYI